MALAAAVVVVEGVATSARPVTSTVVETLAWGASEKTTQLAPMNQMAENSQSGDASESTKEELKRLNRGRDDMHRQKMPAGAEKR